MRRQAAFTLVELVMVIALAGVVAVMISTGPQSMLTSVRYPASPVKDFIEIISSEVPTAAGIESPPSSTSAGTTRNPPPAPTMPVTSPTTSPSMRILASAARFRHPPESRPTGSSRRSALNPSIESTVSMRW